MTRDERRQAMEAICEAEVRCHGWSDEDVRALHRQVTAWWRADAPACEIYMAEMSVIARDDIRQLTTRGLAG